MLLLLILRAPVLAVVPAAAEGNYIFKPIRNTKKLKTTLNFFFFFY
jgi:hypothetical protein